MFSFCFHLSTLIRFRKTHTFLMRFCLSSTTKQPKTLMEATVRDAFFGTVFKSLCFHPFTLETDRFRNDTFSQGSTFETVLNAFSLALVSTLGEKRKIHQKLCVFARKRMVGASKKFAINFSRLQASFVIKRKFLSYSISSKENLQQGKKIV